MTPIPLTDTSRPPQFSCWLYAHGKWLRCFGDFPDCFVMRSEITHWHPDQPDAPTEVPETNPKAESQNPKGDTPRTGAARGFHDMDTAVDAEEMAKLEQELVEARAYADKLAAGLPDGLLPADVDNLRKANGELAQELAEMTEDRDKLLAELAATKAALEAQADYQRSLRADRDRLDWLQRFLQLGGSSVFTTCTGRAQEPRDDDTDDTRWNHPFCIGHEVEVEHRGCYRWEELSNGSRGIRAAIDAAMQKQEGGV